MPMGIKYQMTISHCDVVFWWLSVTDTVPPHTSHFEVHRALFWHFGDIRLTRVVSSMRPIWRPTGWSVLPFTSPRRLFARIAFTCSNIDPFSGRFYKKPLSTTAERFTAPACWNSCLKTPALDFRRGCVTFADSLETRWWDEFLSWVFFFSGVILTSA